MDDARACRAKLSPTQQAKVQRDELEVMEQGGLPGLGSAAPPPTAEVTKLQEELRALNTRLAEAAKRVGAKTDAERDTAAASLEQVQLEMQKLNAKLDAARAASSTGSGAQP